jgi:hypothetical protein
MLLNVFVHTLSSLESLYELILRAGIGETSLSQENGLLNDF